MVIDMAKSIEVPIDYISKNTEFNSEGDLVWSTKVKGRKQWSPVGFVTKNSKGIYERCVTILGVKYRVGRVSWCRKYLSQIPAGMVVDHVDGNPLNNRITNLELKTYSGNNKNKIMQKNNSSGVNGVSFSRDSGLWNSQICRKQLYRGPDFFEAVCARKSAELRDPEITKRHGSALV